MKKKVQVHMLPTGDITGIVLHSTGLNKIVHTKESELNAVLNIGGTPQHLYFTSDEKIEEGDWTFDEFNRVVFKSGSNNPGASRKIVATTDKSLKNGVCGNCKQGTCYDKYLECESLLPQIPQSFIKQYVEDGGKINEVEIEMVEYCERLTCENSECNNGCKEKRLRIKTDSNNCIIIKHIKDNWNREEVAFLCRLAFGQGIIIGKSNQIGLQDLENKWIKENL